MGASEEARIMYRSVREKYRLDRYRSLSRLLAAGLTNFKIIYSCRTNLNGVAIE